ncbi:MAG: gliding motility lipoprotein GldH [Bacteroidia bacterium]|nr:gliding motility lipoprotein GldH [Bacteroidia bacterium]NND52763.1 gliding motility lipoprotein GldH [Flavobacteriaceae bacterium]
MRSNVGLLLCCFLMICIMSCDANRIIDEYVTVPNSWHKDDIIEFQVSLPDTTNAYDVFVNIRNSNDFKYNNLFLIVELNHPNGKVKKDTLEYRMTTAEGEFLGSGFTDVKENKLWYKQGLVFDETGVYTFKIQHAMRENGVVDGIDNLEGIIDIGLRIERPKDNN